MYLSCCLLLREMWTVYPATAVLTMISGPLVVQYTLTTIHHNKRNGVMYRRFPRNSTGINCLTQHGHLNTATVPNASYCLCDN